MASVEKYTQASVYAMLKHNERTAATHSNANINSEKVNQNYRLSPDRDCTDYDYFKIHLENYKCMNRKDIVKMATWIVTAPNNLPPEKEETFFRCCHDFLKERYGSENEIQAIVHYDECHIYQDTKTGRMKASRPHLHYSFIPATIDNKGIPHICAKKVLTKYDLRNFHPDLQRYLHHAGVPGTVYSGVTRQNGGNFQVNEIKRSDPGIERTISVRERSFTF